MDPKISVIIVNWNGRRHLQECLTSITAQTFKDFEVIFVDNGSSDESIDFAERNFPKIRLVRLEKNFGFCIANNIGLKCAHGEFIALLNNDTRVDGQWLEELHKAMLEEDEVGICASCMINYFDPGVLDTAGDGYDICGVGFKIGSGKPVEQYQEKRYVFGACAGGALYRRTMIERIGFFDEDFFAVGEDIDLSFRAKLAGYKCVYVPQAIIYHKVNETVGKGSDFLHLHSRRNVEYTYFKNMPIFLLLATLPFHMIYEVLTGLEAIILGKFSVFWRSKILFLKNIPGVLKKRNFIQKNRVASSFEILTFLSFYYLPQRIKEKVGEV